MMQLVAYKLPPGEVEPSYASMNPRTGTSAHPQNGYRNLYLNTRAPPLAVDTMFRAPVQRPLPCKPQGDMYWKENRPPIMRKERGMVPSQGLTREQGPGLASIKRVDYPILPQAGLWSNMNSPF